MAVNHDARGCVMLLGGNEKPRQSERLQWEVKLPQPQPHGQGVTLRSCDYRCLAYASYPPRCLVACARLSLPTRGSSGEQLSNSARAAQPLAQDIRSCAVVRCGASVQLRA